MEISRAFIEGVYRHGKALLERGAFDCRDVKTANAIRHMRNDLRKIEKKLKNDDDRKKQD